MGDQLFWAAFDIVVLSVGAFVLRAVVLFVIGLFPVFPL